jgi:hypothetical protein
MNVRRMTCAGLATFVLTLGSMASPPWFWDDGVRTPLETIRGLSWFRIVLSTESCSEFNTTKVNNDPIPGLPPKPPGGWIPVDECKDATKRCIECIVPEGSPSTIENVSLTKPKSGPGTHTTEAVSCGDLYEGRCTLKTGDPADGYTCNDDGNSDGLCAAGLVSVPQ